VADRSLRTLERQAKRGDLDAVRLLWSRLQRAHKKAPAWLWPGLLKLGMWPVVPGAKVRLKSMRSWKTRSRVNLQGAEVRHGAAPVADDEGNVRTFCGVKVVADALVVDAEPTCVICRYTNSFRFLSGEPIAKDKARKILPGLFQIYGRHEVKVELGKWNRWGVEEERLRVVKLRWQIGFEGQERADQLLLFEASEEK